MKRPRILVADDHPMILKGIKGLLQDRYAIVGAADNGKALLDAAERLKPDVVILDISMPILNGIDATREIRKILPRTKVVIQTMHSNAVYLRKALEAGASAYVLKTGAAEELLTAIETALKGQLYVPAALNQGAVEAMVDRGSSPPKSPAELTNRQRQILQLVAEGKQNKEIAEILHISVRTVEFHRSRLMGKTGATSIAELTRVAIQEGLVPGPDRV